MKTVRKSYPRNTTDTKERILRAAQIAFSERGYSQAGLREIATQAGVAPSLVVKYFATKAALFDAALRIALAEVVDHAQDRSLYGETLVQAILDPGRVILAPAMIALSLGDDEAREIAALVVREQIIAPMAAWLGGPHARARAANAMMLSTGFAIFNRYMLAEPSAAVRQQSARWLTRTVQAIVDNTADEAVADARAPAVKTAAKRPAAGKRRAP